MYLLHQLAFTCAREYIFLTPALKRMSPADRVLFELSVYFMLLPICYLIYRFIEKPFIKIGYKVTGGVKKEH